jgi:phosphonate transport system substrate-binding protein
MRIRFLWIIFTTLLILAVPVWFLLSEQLAGRSDRAETAALDEIGASTDSIRIGLIPERDIFQQRRRYQALAAYIADRLDRPVELVTNNTYQGVLGDFEASKIDGAFLGSLVAVLAMDRYDARVIAKPKLKNGVTTYRGVLVVRNESPIREVADLAGRSVAMVKATTAGDLFPIAEFSRLGLLGGVDAPAMIWVGTHDAAVRSVVDGHTDAGAVKDIRLDAFEIAHPEARLRRIAVGEAVPNNALLLRSGVADQLGTALSTILLAMDEDPEGRLALEQFGAVRFVPCDAGEYHAVYDMAESLGERWELLAVSGPPPTREDTRQ